MPLFKALVDRLFRPRRTPVPVSRLVMQLAGGTDQERRDAALALAAAGREPWEVVPPLVVALRDDAAGVRVAAADALGHVGAVEAVASLKRALADVDEAVQNAAAEAIWRITGERPERRRGRRVRVDLPTRVEVGSRGAQLTGKVHDLSVSGLFLATSLPWPMPVGTHLDLTLTLAEPLSIQAEVVRQDPGRGGFGCRFLEASGARAQQLWRQVVEEPKNRAFSRSLARMMGLRIRVAGQPAAA